MITHETTPDIWLTKRIHRIQSLLRSDSITLRHHDIAVAAAHNTHAQLLQMQQEGKAVFDLKYIGVNHVIVTGFHTDDKANIYVQFRLRTNGALNYHKLPIQ